jgi:hypothetical protein
LSCTGRSESNGSSGGHCSEQQLQAIPVRRAYLKEVYEEKASRPRQIMLRTYNEQEKPC